MYLSTFQLLAPGVHQHAARHRLPLPRPGRHPGGSARRRQGHLPRGAVGGVQGEDVRGDLPLRLAGALQP